MQDAAEKAVLIPVGAALTAADRFREIAADVRKDYGDLDSAQKRLERDIKRFERRGYTARNRMEREIKKTRTRVERELRQRRKGAERNAKSLRRDVERQTREARKSMTAQVDLASSQVEKAVAQGTKVASQAADRVASIA